MRGRLWLIVGVAVGIAVAAGRLPYLAGAGRSLADTTQRIVGSGTHRVIRDVAATGAPRRLIEGLGGVVAVSVPGLTAWLLLGAARATLRIRSLVSILVALIGLASFVYQPHGEAAGVLILCLAVAAVAIVVSGPLIVAPLAAVATLIGAEFLPGLLLARRHITQADVSAVHLAIFNRAGTPGYLQAALLVVAAVPFVGAARSDVRS